MDISSVISQARDIALRKKALDSRAWTLGEVLMVEGSLGIRDLLDESFRRWEGLDAEDIGLTVFAVSGGKTFHLDSDDIRKFLPHVREHLNLREAVLSYDKMNDGPSMGRHFVIETPEEIIRNNWGRTRHGARESVERAVRRIYAERQMEQMTPILAERGLEIHAYAKDGKPEPPTKPADEIVIEPPYALMPEGRERTLALLASRVATVDDVLHANKHLLSLNFIEKLKEMSDTVHIENQKKVEKTQEKTR